MNKDDASIGTIGKEPVTRRGFLGGTAAGSAWLALGSTTAVLTAATAHGQLLSTDKNSVTTSRLVLEIDGKPAAILQAAEGGNTVLALADPVVNDPRPAALTVNDLRLEVLLVSPRLIDWIQRSLSGQGALRLIHVVGYTSSETQGYREFYRRALYNARLMEISLPGIQRDGALTPATFVVRIAADQSSTKWPTSMPYVTLPSHMAPPQNYNSVVWVQGLETTVALASAVSWDGLKRRPDGQWTSGPLVLTLASAITNPLEEWMDQVLRQQTGERPGGIRLYDHSRSQVMASIDFPALGISSIETSLVSRAFTTGAKVEFYCRGGAKLNLNGLML